jgi:predicted Zn-dependent protease
MSLSRRPIFCLLGMILSLLLLFAKHSWAYSPYSTKELEQLEKEFVEQINQANNVIRDPLANQYINHLGEILARHGHLPQPYFFIVKSSEINAFAGPGGYIGMNSQLILATENESELAAVMAHEMAHVRLHHLYRLIEHQKQMRVPMLASVLASIALGMVNPTLGSGALMASLTGFSQDNINFIRSNEKEADRIGINMLIKSGFDPRGMASFFKKMQQNSRYYYTANIPAILRTHPLDDERIAEAENRSSNLNQKYVDTLEYRLFKELIRVAVTSDSKQLLEYYQRQCLKNNTPLACDYGYVLTLLQNNQYQPAKSKLLPILNQHPDNLYFVIAMSQAEIGCKEYASAVKRLKELETNYPENYASIISYAQSLIEANQPEEATLILLKGTRRFPKDLSMCEQLARAQAANHRKDYAYFTKAQCQLLQGRRRDAARQLNMAKSLAKNDHLLLARIDAKMDEIKYLEDNN